MTKAVMAAKIERFVMPSPTGLAFRHASFVVLN